MRPEQILKGNGSVTAIDTAFNEWFVVGADFFFFIFSTCILAQSDSDKQSKRIRSGAQIDDNSPKPYRLIHTWFWIRTSPYSL